MLTKILRLRSGSARGGCLWWTWEREVAASIFALWILLLLPEEEVIERPRTEPFLLIPRTELA